MRLREVTSDMEWGLLETLYTEAFPENERKPFAMIREKHREKRTDVWMIEQNDEFSGLAITMNSGDLVLLDYFAISKEKRGNGLGGESLKILFEMYREKRFFLEVESLSVPADNIEERRRRKQFYLNNGMTELGVNARLFGVEFELLGYDCEVSFPEYFSLYDDIYGSYASRFLEEIK
ncbi:MAG: GNAT family N-acetyltransferase [Lachnospiraceae bacterium]|nr:GNAT family N-acetyltransferase [Lachnospiraceae bacterium]